MSVSDHFKEYTAFTSEEMQQADSEVGILTLLKGRTAIGDDFWVYLLVPPSKYISLYETTEFTDKNFNEYGVVIDWGIGEEPPQMIKDEMEFRFGANHNLENEIVEKAKKIENRMRVMARVARRVLDNDMEGLQKEIEETAKKIDRIELLRKKFDEPDSTESGNS